MRTTSLDDSHADSQGYYLPPAIRPASRARSGFSASRTGSVDGTGVDRLSYQFPANHSLALDPLDTYHHTQQFHGSRSGVHLVISKVCSHDKNTIFIRDFGLTLLKAKEYFIFGSL
jgi:hypothetical protein